MYTGTLIDDLIELVERAEKAIPSSRPREFVRAGVGACEDTRELAHVASESE